jgi:hypothetical protein
MDRLSAESILALALADALFLAASIADPRIPPAIRLFELK